MNTFYVLCLPSYLPGVPLRWADARCILNYFGKTTDAIFQPSRSKIVGGIWSGVKSCGVYLTLSSKKHDVMSAKDARQPDVIITVSSRNSEKT